MLLKSRTDIHEECLEGILAGMKDKKIIKSVGLTTIIKPVGMIVSFIYTPMLLAYLGEEKYGIWITVLTVINWINYFDVGIGNGLRNCLASEVGQRKYDEAEKSVSTAYVIITLITLIIYIIVVFFSLFLDFNKLFNTSENIKPVLFISFTLLCINFIISLQKTESFAVQKPEYVSFTELFTQIMNLTGVGLLSITIIHSDKLITMAFLFGFSNIVINLAFSVILWRKNKFLVPKVNSFDKRKLGIIGKLGTKFFIIQMSMIILYTSDSLIIMRLYGASLVTPYNTVYKVYGAANSIFAAMLSPFWSKFTTAHDSKDYGWIKKIIKKLLCIWVVTAIIMIISIPFYQTVSGFWLNYDLIYQPFLIVSMVVYYVLMMHSSILSSFLNGIGDVNIQMYANVIAAVINIPVSLFLAVTCNLKTAGICLGTVVSLLVINIILEIQIRRIFKRIENDK